MTVPETSGLGESLRRGGAVSPPSVSDWAKASAPNGDQAGQQNPPGGPAEPQTARVVPPARRSTAISVAAPSVPSGEVSRTNATERPSGAQPRPDAPR